MLMKVFPKGQVVIPAGLRKELGIAVGDLLDVTVDPREGIVVLRRRSGDRAGMLAGSLAGYAKARKFPTKRRMAGSLEKGLANGF